MSGVEIERSQTVIVQPGGEEPSDLQLVLDLQEAGAITPVSLDFSDPKMPYERYVAVGRLLGRVKRSSSWWIGDWLNFGEGLYGEKYAQAAEALGLAPDTLMNYAWVARNVTKSRRVEHLPFGCHAEVAPLEPEEQREWLQKALDSSWSRSELRGALREAKVGNGRPAVEEEERRRSAAEITRREAIEEAARGVWRSAQPDGDSFRIPREAFARLAAALGEGE
jgi:hypothetical protein